MTSNSKISPAIFAATILCFLLPFVSVSCGGQKLATFSGVQLAAGTTLDSPQPFGPPKKEKVDAEPTATVAGICALIGLGLSFAGAKRALLPTICGAAGGLSLLLMKSRLEGQITKQGQGVLQMNYEAGYSLALILLFAAAAWNAYLLTQKGRISPGVQLPAPAVNQARGDPAGAVPAAMAAGGGGNVPLSNCPHCGERLDADAKFCSNCGGARQ